MTEQRYLCFTEEARSLEIRRLLVNSVNRHIVYRVILTIVQDTKWAKAHPCSHLNNARW